MKSVHNDTVTEQIELSNVWGLEAVKQRLALGIKQKKIAEEFGKSRRAVYDLLQKEKAGEPQTHPTGFSNPTETQGASSKDSTAVSPEAEGIGS